MSMDAAAWNSLHRVMNTQDGPQRLTKETLKRIGGFAAPHKRRLVHFLVLSVVSACLAVATPVLAGQVVNAIVDGDSRSKVFGIAGLIALIAVGGRSPRRSGRAGSPRRSVKG